MTDLALSEKRAREQTLKRIEAELQRDPRLLSAHSQRAYLSDLTGFETWRAGRPITKLLVEEYAAGLQKNKRSPNSINRALAAVRWWARRMADLAYESRDLSKNSATRWPARRRAWPRCMTWPASACPRAGTSPLPS